MNSSMAERSTRIRDRAQQSWPALAKTATGAAAAAASRSASAKTTLADLPPSSSVTRLIVCAAPAPIPRPTSVDPVKAILATSGCSTRRFPHTDPGPATTLSTPCGRPASSAMRSSSIAVKGVSSAGLRTTVLPAARAGATFHEAITSGKFQGVIRPTTPSGSRKVMSTPPATGIVRPEQALGSARVVAEAVDHHRDLAPRVGDRLAGVARLQRRQLVGAGARARRRARAAGRRDRRGRRRARRRTRRSRRRPRRRSPRPRRAASRPSPARSRARRPRSRGDRLLRATATSAAITRLRSSSSACQRTPSTQRRSGSSIASTTSSPSSAGR